MKELSFKVMREMTGDKDYKTGDKRDLVALDAIHLVRSGALEPANEECRKVMAELMNETPEDRSGVVQQVKADAPRNKDAGNAPANKGGGRKGASGGKAAAAPAGSANAAGGPATGTGSGDDGQGGGTGGEGGTSTETQGASGDGTDTTNGGDGSTGGTTGGATGAPPVAKKRR